MRAPMAENGFEVAAVPHRPSSSCSNGETGEDGRILELSEIIVTEMRASQVRPPRAAEIYRVPETLLAADKGAYQPRFLSLGPYHRGDSATVEMRSKDGEKPGNLAYAVEGGGPSVVEYMKAIASIQADARSRYEGDVDMEWGAFCRMLLLDAFQLITLLEYLGYHDDEPAEAETGGCDEEEGDCRPRTGVLSSIGHDLMMLENQIPFIVAEKMYGLRYGDGGGSGIAELAWRTMTSIMRGVPSAASHPPAECQHLVHLCHAYLKPSKNLGCCRPGARREYGRLRRATEYHEAGVRFRRLCNQDGRPPQCPLLDVSFSNGVLRMARHRIDETTNYILRNVLVYEQRYLGQATSGDTGYVVAAYVVFMSQLLGNPEDVALLSRRGIIEHHLGDDAEVCALFRGLAKGLVFDPSSNHYLNTVGVKLHAYYRSRIKRWGAWVLRHRLGNPWLAAAWFFGAMAVLGTILQTVVALLQYLNSKGP